MSWPECLRGYASLGILQTISSLIWTVSGRGKQMHLSIEGREQGEGGLHKFEMTSLKETLFIHLPKSVGQLTASPSYQAGLKHKQHTV